MRIAIRSSNHPALSRERSARDKNATCGRILQWIQGRTDGFYEWQTGAASGPKQPYFVRAKRSEGGAAPPLAFAGLWETWTGPNGEELDTAAIVTTDANRILSAIYPRMPAFIAPADFDRWLDCDAVPAEEAAALIKPAEKDSEALIAPLSAQTAAERVAPQQPPKPSKIKKSDDQPTLF